MGDGGDIVKTKLAHGNKSMHFNILLFDPTCIHELILSMMISIYYERYRSKDE